jgi:hypothetical protein
MRKVTSLKSRKSAPAGRKQRNISLTDPVNEWLEARAEREGFDNATTFAVELIRRAYVADQAAIPALRKAA